MKSPVMLDLILGRIKDWRVERFYEQPVFHLKKHMFSPSIYGRYVMVEHVLPV